MLNTVTLQCRLTKDPEVKSTQSGIPVALFSVACERDFKNKETGEKETDFFDVVAWRHTAEFLSKYFEKGSMAVVQGRLEQQKWTDKEGQNRTTIRLVADNVYFGGTKKKEESNTSGYGQTGGYNQGGYGQNTQGQYGNNQASQGSYSQGGYNQGSYGQGGNPQGQYANQTQGSSYGGQNQQMPEQIAISKEDEENLPF